MEKNEEWDGNVEEGDEDDSDFSAADAESASQARRRKRGRQSSRDQRTRLELRECFVYVGNVLGNVLHSFPIFLTCMSFPRFHSLPFSFLFSLQNRQPAGTNTLCNRCEYGQRRVGNDRFYAEIFTCKRKLRLAAVAWQSRTRRDARRMHGGSYVHIQSHFRCRTAPCTPTSPPTCNFVADDHVPLERCCSIGCSRGAEERCGSCPFSVECCAQKWVRRQSGWVWRGTICTCCACAPPARCS